LQALAGSTFGKFTEGQSSARNLLLGSLRQICPLAEFGRRAVCVATDVQICMTVQVMLQSRRVRRFAQAHEFNPGRIALTVVRALILCFD